MGLKKRIRLFIAKIINNLLNELYENQKELISQKNINSKEDEGFSEKDKSINSYDAVNKDIRKSDRASDFNKLANELLVEWLYGLDSEEDVEV